MKFKRIIFICFFPVSLIACSIEAKSDSEELRHSFEASTAYLQLDTPIYKAVDSKAENKVSDAVYDSALMKVSILKGYEEQSLFNGQIEDNVVSSQISDLCWLGKFVSDYSKIRLTDNPERLKTLQWLENKRTKWRAIIKKEYADPRFVSSKDYCPY
ncbi:hypothetical protein [Acinetobacter guillouiae]|uniref:Lipoprotein n=2 Tax=Acinetobacter guillouiae TaxID=106649 RepID=N8YCH4_ACIGI|nr:hypothetical protein [Acinetobacter guillouiae]ENV17010.1 hypothetical protein F964_02759 [Acinetobacter guillouiae NIPH 991]MCF0265892.1 hypothetical protein [Acinetobacter guillouiae]